MITLTVTRKRKFAGALMPFRIVAAKKETMRRNQSAEYCYEAYFGIVPFINTALNIEQAPAMWIAFSDSQSEETRQAVHALAEQTAESLHFKSAG